MNRLAVSLSALALLLYAYPSLAIFPGQSFGLAGGIGDGYLSVRLEQGWAHGSPAWYACFATNDIRWAHTENLTLAPKLRTAAANGVSLMYVVTNHNQTATGRPPSNRSV